MAVSANRPVRLTAVAALSAVALLMTGCSGEAGGEDPTSAATEAATSPSSSETTGGVSGSPSASPSASATGSYEPATSEGPAKNVPVPEMPEAVKEPTEEGLEAAVEYWWEAENFLKATGNPDPMTGVSGDDCVVCQELIEDWTWVYGEGGWAVAEAADIDIRVASIDDAGGTFIVLVSEKPGHVFQPDGTLVESASSTGSDETPWTGSATFIKESGNWRIDEWLVEGS